MTTVERMLRDTLRQYVRRMPQFPALLGDGVNDDITIDGWPGWVWARVGSDEVLERVYNNRVPNRANLPVIVGYDSVQPRLFQVLSIREVYAGAGTGDEQIPQIPPHRYTHQWPAEGDSDGDGSDLIHVHWRQMRGLRVYIVSGFTVGIDEWRMIHDGVLTEIDEQSINLAGDVPASGWRLVRIYVDSDGVLGKDVGTIYAEVDFDFETAAPAADLDDLTLAYVMLKDDMTELTDDSMQQDITDARWPQSGGAHEIISETHTDSTGSPVVGDVLTYTSADKWAPRPPSGGGGGGGGTAEAAIGPRWHADGPLAVVDEIDGVWILTSDWRVETIYLYVETLGTASSTIIDIEKSSNDAATWTSIFPSGAPEIAHDNADNMITASPPSAQILAAGTLLRCNIDQVATGARGITVEIDGLYQEGLSSASLLPVMGVG